MEQLKITLSKKQLKPGITVVIVTYRRPKFLESILMQLKNQTKPPLEVIVVDNDINRSGKIVVEQCNFSFEVLQIKYIPNDVNSLAVGRNLGVSLVETKFTCLLDDDVVIPNNYLEQVFLRINDLPNAVGVQGILNLGDRSKFGNVLAFITGNFYISRNTCKVRWSISASYPKYSDRETPIKCDWISGTNQFYLTHIIKAVRWDENFTKYSDGEDLDHSFRVNSSGMGSLYLLPNLLINHLETAEARITGYQNILMRESYSFYLLHKLFPRNKLALIFFLWSRVSTLLLEFIEIPFSGFQKNRAKVFRNHLTALFFIFKLRTELRSLNTTGINNHL